MIYSTLNYTAVLVSGKSPTASDLTCVQGLVRVIRGQTLRSTELVFLLSSNSIRLTARCEQTEALFTQTHVEPTLETGQYMIRGSESLLVCPEYLS